MQKPLWLAANVLGRDRDQPRFAYRFFFSCVVLIRGIVSAGYWWLFANVHWLHAPAIGELQVAELFATQKRNRSFQKTGSGVEYIGLGESKRGQGEVAIVMKQMHVRVGHHC